MDTGKNRKVHGVAIAIMASYPVWLLLQYLMTHRLLPGQDEPCSIVNGKDECAQNWSSVLLIGVALALLLLILVGSAWLLSRRMPRFSFVLIIVVTVLWGLLALFTTLATYKGA